MTMITYRITYLIGQLDNSVCPPPVLSVIFPAYDGSQLVISDQSQILVTFDTPQTPVDLGPLVKVETVPSAE
jgi:hypothetical protein